MVVGRQAGRSDGFHYSPGFGKADFVWGDARLDDYLANPQGEQMIVTFSMIPSQVEKLGGRDLTLIRDLVLPGTAEASTAAAP